MSVWQGRGCGQTSSVRWVLPLCLLLFVSWAPCSHGDSSEGGGKEEDSPADGGVRLVVMDPPDRFVFESSEEVQVLAAVDG